MPVVSKSQNRFMRAAASRPAMARKLGIKQSVAKEFIKTEKGKSLSGLPEKVKKKMSADLLARKVTARLREIREDKINALRRCKPRAPMVIEGAAVPAATAEEIAFFAIDTNATIDAINMLMLVVEEEYKKLTNPEEPVDDINQKARINYG